VSHPGPLCLIDGDFTEERIEEAARIVARYSKGRNATEVELEYRDTQGNTRQVKVAPLPPHELKEEWIV